MLRVFRGFRVLKALRLLGVFRVYGLGLSSCLTFVSLRFAPLQMQVARAFVHSGDALQAPPKRSLSSPVLLSTPVRALQR